MRNADDIVPPFARTETYKKSFIQRAIRLWNNLDWNQRNISDFKSFSNALKKNDPTSDKLKYLGDRNMNIILARLRMGCSQLNSDLYNMNIINERKCRCNHPREDLVHYFMDCPRYDDQRRILYEQIFPKTQFTVRHLLYGDPHLSNEDNEFIINKTIEFIRNTRRFD